MRNPNIRYNFFNWTMTYRLDSDIVQRDSYGIIIPHQRYLPARYPTPRPSDGDDSTRRKAVLKVPSTTKNLAGKKKMIAWFVSHCNTTSKREIYVRQLAQFVPIDIYGACGNMSCTVRHECWNMLKADYKFYIGFEVRAIDI